MTVIAFSHQSLCSKPPMSQRCQLVKTLSNAHPIRLKSPSKTTTLCINDIQYKDDLEQLVREEQQLVDAEGTGCFFLGINKSWVLKKMRLIGTWLKTMATESLVNSLWKPGRQPSSWVEDSLALISAYQHLQHPKPLWVSQEQMCRLCQPSTMLLQSQPITAMWLGENSLINYPACRCMWILWRSSVFKCI